MKVELSAAARTALREIASYIARDNPIRAVSFVMELQTKAQAIGQFPAGFPVVPRYERQGVRRRNFGNFAIFYRVENTKVVILHILHAARDIEAILPPDD